MILSLIGMSGCGKTLWSKKLKNLGFTHICCDDLIEKKLEPELTSLGYSGIQNVAKWLGQPHEPQFAQNQLKYLTMEKKVMREILLKLKNNALKNSIIDTSGSVIYTGPEICTELKKYTTIAYLKIPDSEKDKMLQQYFNNPKPVIWGNVFQKSEDNITALKKYYPKLLEYRAEFYAKYADIVLDCENIKNYSAKKFIYEILQHQQ